MPKPSATPAPDAPDELDPAEHAEHAGASTAELEQLATNPAASEDGGIMALAELARRRLVAEDAGEPPSL